jgi:hypothetical protein
MRDRCMGKAEGLYQSEKESGLDGPALCRKILEGLDSRGDIGFCRVCKLVPTKENGYVQVSWGGANKFCVLEELLLWSQGVTLVDGHQCSHLCCEPLCLLPEHVCSESCKNNNLRKGCLVWVDCPHCSLKILVCKHEPSCIKFCPGFGSWSEFVENGVHAS